MSFRTYHFDGVVRVPSYIEWLLDSDMRETYEYHQQVLKLLQWHCKPNLWHLRTPVHMFALDAFVEAYPNAKFLWSHRDPAKVLGSVCSLISYIRSWSSDRKDPHELGAEQLAWWAKGIGRAMEFRKKFGDDRFVDVSFADLQTDSVKTVADSYEQAGPRVQRRSAGEGAGVGGRAQAGPRGTHTYELADFGLTDGAGARGVRRVPRDLRRIGLIGSGWNPSRHAVGRTKLEPDPRVRMAILAAASKIVREEGVRRAERRPSAEPRAAEHPGVLPAFRLQGPAGVGGVPGHGARRDARGSKQRMAADPTRCARWRPGSTAGWTWPSTTRSAPICARCR